MELDNKTSKPNKDTYSYLELNKIRAKSVDTIRKIRKMINFQNINGSDNATGNKHLQVLGEDF